MRVIHDVVTPQETDQKCKWIRQSIPSIQDDAAELVGFSAVFGIVDISSVSTICPDTLAVMFGFSTIFLAREVVSNGDVDPALPGQFISVQVRNSQVQ